jgi:hypothetical protein
LRFGPSEQTLLTTTRQAALPLFCLTLCILGLHPFRQDHRLSAQDRHLGHERGERRLQALVNDLRTKLGIPEEVVASIVPYDPLLVSVAPPEGQTGPFRLSVELAFLQLLTEDELTATIAHELGHVWVFTHHPYLQTEGLANEIAMRVVTRESLERVYAKVWQRGGTKGDLTTFLGARETKGLAGADSAP